LLKFKGTKVIFFIAETFIFEGNPPKTNEMKKVWIIALLAFAACKNDTKSTEESSNEEKLISAHRTFEKFEIESILENDS